MRVIVEPVWPWITVIAAVAGLVALVLLTYPSRVRHLPKLHRRLLLSLRLASVAALALAMLRPALEFRNTDMARAIFYFLGDASQSMNTQDGPGGTTRRRAVLNRMEECRSILDQLGKSVDVRFVDFAEKPTRVERFVDEANGGQTAIGAALDWIGHESQGQRVAGIFLLSDGAQRALSPNNADPIASARRLGERQIPVYTRLFRRVRLLSERDGCRRRRPSGRSLRLRAQGRASEGEGPLHRHGRPQSHRAAARRRPQR